MKIALNNNKLAMFLQLREWSRKDLARALGFSESYIGLIFTGRREPSREFMVRLVQLTGLQLGDLFFCPETYQKVGKN